MWFFRTRLTLILAVLWVSACQPDIQPVPPLPTPQTWRIQTTPALRWLGPVFEQCALQQPGINLLVAERATAQLDPAQADFVFQWGERANPPSFSAVIGAEGLDVVVNLANPLAQLSVNEARDLFSGNLDHWSQLSKTSCPGCGTDFTGPVQAYVYPPGEDLHAVANWLPGGSAAVLAPDPAALRAAVAVDPSAIGTLPAHWVDATVKVVRIVGAEPQQISHPLLALAAQEPQGARRAWLLCVQNQLK